MKRIILMLLVIALTAPVYAVNFTNAVKYRVTLDGWWPDGPVQLSDAEDGSAWQKGHIIQIHPTLMLTNLPTGVTADIGRISELSISAFTILVTADEINAASGANQTKKAINAIKAKVRELGVRIAEELAN